MSLRGLDEGARSHRPLDVSVGGRVCQLRWLKVWKASNWDAVVDAEAIEEIDEVLDRWSSMMSLILGSTDLRLPRRGSLEGDDGSDEALGGMEG